MLNCTTMIAQRTWVAVTLTVILGTPSTGAAQTHQQKQYAEHQKQVELEKKRRDDYLKRQNQNAEETRRLTEQQRMRQRQSVQAGQSNQTEVRQEKVNRIEASANSESSGADSSRPPKAINAAQEVDPEKVVKYIDDWHNHFNPLSNGAVQIQVQAINGGFWKRAVIFDSIERGCEVIESEFKLLIVAERLAARVKNQPERREAARVIHRIYHDFPEHIIEAAKGYWAGGISEIRLDAPDLAGQLETDLIGVLKRLETEFIAPRTDYWLEQTR